MASEWDMISQWTPLQSFWSTRPTFFFTFSVMALGQFQLLHDRQSQVFLSNWPLSYVVVSVNMFVDAKMRIVWQQKTRRIFMYWKPLHNEILLHMLFSNICFHYAGDCAVCRHPVPSMQLCFLNGHCHPHASSSKLLVVLRGRSSRGGYTADIVSALGYLATLTL